MFAELSSTWIYWIQTIRWIFFRSRFLIFKNVGADKIGMQFRRCTVSFLFICGNIICIYVGNRIPNNPNYSVLLCTPLELFFSLQNDFTFCSYFVSLRKSWWRISFRPYRPVQSSRFLSRNAMNFRLQKCKVEREVMDNISEASAFLFRSYLLPRACGINFGLRPKVISECWLLTLITTPNEELGITRHSSGSYAFFRGEDEEGE